MDTVTLTREEAAKLAAAVESLGAADAEFDFSYAVARTKRSLAAFTDSVREMSTPAEAFLAHETERFKLCREYAVKDPNGEPITRNNNFVIQPDKQALFERRLDGLKERNAEALTAEDARTTRRAEFMAGEEEFKVHRIDKEFVPKLAQWKHEAMLPMIRTDDEPLPRAKPRAVETAKKEPRTPLKSAR